MKRLFTYLLVVPALSFVACGDEKPQATGEEPTATESTTNQPAFEWLDEIDRDLQQVKFGEVVRLKYRFKNVGESDLKIERVKPICGCTELGTWPQEAVKPGDEGEIELVFHSGRLKPGMVVKGANVISNAPGRVTELRFRAELVEG